VRLKRLDIRGFGRLRGSFPLDADSGNVALLLERNETGKSTLSAAILASLYGMESDRRKARDRMVERDVYRPWEGGPYGLTLYLEKDGEELAIDRDLERETVRVLSGGSDITDRFRQGLRVAVGEGLLGLSREQFERSAFVAQGEVVWSGTEGLTEALQRIADTRAGDTTAAAAIAALEAALAGYEGLTLRGRGRVDTEIERCLKVLEETRTQFAALTQQRARMAAKIDGLARRKDEAASRELQRAALRHEKSRAERMRADDRLAQDDQRRQKVAALEAQLGDGAELLALGETSINVAEAAWTNVQGALRAARENDAEADDAAQRRNEASTRRDGLHLRRRPTEGDRDALQSARVRSFDAQRERQRFEGLLQSAVSDLQVQGFTLEQARSLAASFADLSDDDRLALASRTRDELQLRQQQEEREEEIDRLRYARAEIRRGQQSRKHFGIWLMLVGMLPVLVGLSMHVILPFSPLLLHAPGVLVILVGMGVYASGTRYRKREDAQARVQLERLGEILERLLGDTQQRAQAWADLAGRLGCLQPELEDHYRRLRAVVEPALHHIEGLQARLDELAAMEHEALQSCARAWTLFEDEPAADLLAERVELVKQATEVWAEADRAGTAADTARWRADESKRRLAERQREAREALATCGVRLADAEPLEGGVRRLKERVVLAQRLEQLRDVTLPEQRASVLAPAERGRLEQRVREIDADLSRMEAETLGLRALLAGGGGATASRLEGGSGAGPSGAAGGVARAAFAGASGADAASRLPRAPRPPRPIEQIDADLEALAASERAEQQAGETDRAEARAFLAKYEAEAPRLMESIAQHEAALQRAEQFREAVVLARDTLARIAKETHRDWASALNRTTQEMLAGLGSEVRELRFDEHLGIQLRQGQQVMTGSQAAQQLSAGALDGVYLAARLGVSRLLSGGLGSLPLLLDDPFSNADDVRLVAGLRLLLDAIAPRQQVVLMACQEARYKWARAQLQDAQRLVVLRVGVGADADASAEGGGDA
jgi:hypothetical protein